MTRSISSGPGLGKDGRIEIDRNSFTVRGFAMGKNCEVAHHGCTSVLEAGRQVKGKAASSCRPSLQMTAPRPADMSATSSRPRIKCRHPVSGQDLSVACWRAHHSI